MEDVMRFPQITQAIENTFDNDRAFLITNLDRAVETCARQAAQYQQKATMTLRLTFNPEGDVMNIEADLDTKLPKPKAFPIHAYVDRQGRLVSEDPRQQKLPMNITPIRNEEAEVND